MLLGVEQFIPQTVRLISSMIMLRKTMKKRPDRGEASTK